MAEPGSSCPHGGDGQMSPRPPGTTGWPWLWPPPCVSPCSAKQHLPGGEGCGQAAPPEPGQGVPRRGGDPSTSGVTGAGWGGNTPAWRGGTHTQSTHLGTSAAPPAAQMSPRASRSGYRLRLQLPFIAPGPVPSPPPATARPGGHPRVTVPRDTLRHLRSDPRPATGCVPPLLRVPPAPCPPLGTEGGFVPTPGTHRGCPGVAGAAGRCRHLRHPPGDTHGCWVASTCPLHHARAVLVAGQSRMVICILNTGSSAYRGRLPNEEAPRQNKPRGGDSGGGAGGTARGAVTLLVHSPVPEHMAVLSPQFTALVPSRSQPLSSHPVHSPCPPAAHRPCPLSPRAHGSSCPAGPLYRHTSPPDPHKTVTALVPKGTRSLVPKGTHPPLSPQGVHLSCPFCHPHDSHPP